MPDANGELEAERRELDEALAKLTPATNIAEADTLGRLIARAYPYGDQAGARVNMIERVAAAAKWKGEAKRVLRSAVTHATKAERLQSATNDPAERLAVRLMEGYENHFLYDGRWFRSYTGTHWQTIPLDRVKRELIKLASPAGARADASGKVMSMPTLIDGTMKLLTPLAAGSMPEQFRDRQRVFVNVQNGTLKFDARKSTMTLHKHAAEDGLFSTLSVAYNEKASCPVYDKLVRDIFARTHYQIREDEGEYGAVRAVLLQAGADEFSKRHTFAGIEFDGAETWKGRTGWIESGDVAICDVDDNVRFYEEVAGYAMTSFRGFNRFVVFHGREGVNGKSMLSRLIKEFIPEEAIQAIPDLGVFTRNQFSLSQLRSKLLAICDDMNKGRSLAPHAGFIKQLSWNTELSSDEKWERTFASFMNTSLLFLIGNDIGSSKELDPAVLERLLLFDFNMRFRRDDSVWEGVFGSPSEMAGVFLRFVRGLLRALKRGSILPTRAADFAKAEWIADFNVFSAHLRDRATTNRFTAAAHGNSNGTPIKDFYQSLCAYLYEQRHPGRPPTQREYKTILRKMNYEIYDSGAQGFSVRGLWLKPEKEYPFTESESDGQNVFSFRAPPEREPGEDG